MIQERPQEFLELLNQADEGDEGGDDEDPLQGGAEGVGAGGQGPPGTVTIILSPQDQQAINRVRYYSLNSKSNKSFFFLVTRYGF